MNVKQGRLQAVIGLALIIAGLTVLGGWALVGPTTYNSIPFLGVAIVATGALLNWRSGRAK